MKSHSHSKNSKKWHVVRPPLAPRFELPSKDELFRVKSGDLIKLMFQAGSDSPERMWVTVEQCGDMEDWTGRLDNDPAQDFTAGVLKAGQLVHFHPFDVIGLWEDAQPIEDTISEIVDTKMHMLTNKLPEESRPWYKNPTVIVGILGVIATIIAALI